MPETIILKPKITVFGIGGAGGNAVNNMLAAKLQGASFVVANTDAQALEYSSCENKIQLGVNITRGLGAGASPEIGALAAEESIDEIKSYLEEQNMVFITAGMGGGTGTGASAIVAKVAKEMGILTVGIVTKPFEFEGMQRMRTADKGVANLQQYVDTLIIIPNQNLFRIATPHTTFADAFKMADEVLNTGVRGITDLMIMPGLINLDFADIRAVMREMGKAMMGTGEASGDERAIRAAEAAISNPLLDHSSVRGAKGVLINITGGDSMTLFEVDIAANKIRSEVGNSDANIIFGSTFNSQLNDTIRVSVVATGIDSEVLPKSTAHIFSPVNSDIESLTEDEQETPISPTEVEAPRAEQYNLEQEVKINLETINPTPAAQGLGNTPKYSPIRSSPNIPPINKSSSLFSKMWNSLKSSSPDKSSSMSDTSSSSSTARETDTTTIREIPTFLRKQK